MPAQQEVAGDQIRSLVQSSAERNTPIALTCRMDEAWRNYHSRFLGVRDGQLWVEYARASEGDPPPELTAGQLLGIAFKQRHHKYVFTARILAIADFHPLPEVTIRGLRLEWPTRMQKLQRRMFYRVTVPASQPIFAGLWRGTHDSVMETGTRIGGQVIDLSAGGVRVRLLENQAVPFQVGEALKIELRQRKDNVAGESIRADAIYRHTANDEFGVTVGLQLVGLTETAKGRATFNQLGQIIAAFQKNDRRHGGARY